MPLVQLFLPEGHGPGLALDPLAATLCGLAIRAMGGNPAEPAAQETTRCEVIRPRVVSGGRMRADLVRVGYLLPEGGLSRVRKARLVRETTETLLAALGGDGSERAAIRVWVTLQETPDFAAGGRFWTRRQIAEWVLRARAAA